MIKRESIDRLFEITAIDEVVSDFVTLKRRGANMIGLCPFHDENTPSFTVSPSKGIFKCFGCGESGNAVGFVMKHEQLSFPNAVRYLARKYNVELEETEDSTEEKQLKDERESLYAITNYALTYFQNQLFNTEKGKAIGLSYFKQRGYLEKTIKQFCLGYAPEGFHNLLNDATDKQFDSELLKKAGLIGKKNGNLYDFFRDRVMFPIHNHSGNVVAFAGRTLSRNKKLPKYVNSAETAIYHKSRVLYGLYFAKQSIRKEDNCFFVEGYTDVISLHQAGIQNVVATSGTSLTNEQIKLIKRYTEQLTLLFDGDAAGLKAAMRGVDLILPHDVNVRVVALPEDHDPDSFIKEKGHTGFIEYVKKHATDFILFKLNYTLAGRQKDPVKRAEAAKSVIESIALIPDSIKRSFYAYECAERLGIEEQLLHIEINKARRAEQKRQQKITAQEKRQQDRLEASTFDSPVQTNEEKLVQDKGYFMEKEIVRVLLEYSHFELEETMTVADYILYELEHQHLQQPHFQKIVDIYRTKNTPQQPLTLEQMANHTDEDVVKAVIEATSYPYDLSPNWWEKHEIRIEHEKSDIFKEETYFTMASYKLFGAQNILDQEIEKLKTTEDEAEQMQIMQYIQTLKKIIKENSDKLNRNYYLH